MKMYTQQMTIQHTQSLTKAWVALTRAQHHVRSYVEEALKEAGLPPLVWYDVLLELNREPDRGRRSIEIESRMLLPQYGLSRLLDRIEKAGYITRERCRDDGRGRLIFISESGRHLLDQMWSVYRAALDETIGVQLSQDEMAILADLLAKIYHG